mmetsp:Transcript_35927/g.57363  ORF Transcript_35927/g.57363 Transcript_35927/m.57363 type:complete len:543 (+) Transcript_35927:446-2074(+)|eukprot:CAMPEP_0203753154 /NCGR_PEP_ID=MMETSP0098-20131031/6962_1 /ASSEMBLY_ACC=CAM_ASM_000208 /TAXON_ID=96639 /ORGANISM=" , Strain NY0313808BC1" /LENGTH=542 /DNA_ID=CAMNT_0050643625 /DNA_START=391 /DNA_END=2019 /DNA_ORIENTATION=+
MESVLLVGTPIVSQVELKRLLQQQQLSEVAGDRVDRKDLVLDDQGRRRFHGAFTGGFSAGYFGTVGSEEGWKPSTFSSNRRSGATNGRIQRPEDFMDEEDDVMFGRSIRSDAAFDSAGTQLKQIAERAQLEESMSLSKKRRSVLPLGAFPGIKPIEGSFGKQILRTFGWREGQGIGPIERVGFSGKRVLDDGTFEVDLYAAGKRFAPKNIPVFLPPARTNNVNGLGYVASAGESFLDTSTKYPTASVSKSGIKMGVVIDDDNDMETMHGGMTELGSFSVLAAMNARLEEGHNQDQMSEDTNPFSNLVLGKEETVSEKKYPEFIKPDVCAPPIVRRLPGNDSLALQKAKDIVQSLAVRFQRESSALPATQSCRKTTEENTKETPVPATVKPARESISWVPEKIVCKRFAVDYKKVSVPMANASLRGSRLDKDMFAGIAENAFAESAKLEDELTLQAPPSSHLLKSIFGTDKEHSSGTVPEEVDEDEHRGRIMFRPKSKRGTTALVTHNSSNELLQSELGQPPRKNKDKKKKAKKKKDKKRKSK